MLIFTTAIMLFFIMDPLGNVPMFVAILKNVPPKRRVKVLARELLIALGILLFFFFAGKQFLHYVGITTPAITIAGGLILFLISLDMIFPKESHDSAPEYHTEPLIVPLAVPLVAGPSAISVLMISSVSNPGHMWEILIALLIAWGLNSIILMLSFPLAKLMGERVMNATTRLMGMLLTALAVEMFLQGIKDFVNAGIK